MYWILLFFKKIITIILNFLRLQYHILLRTNNLWELFFFFFWQSILNNFVLSHTFGALSAEFSIPIYTIDPIIPYFNASSISLSPNPSIDNEDLNYCLKWLVLFCTFPWGASYQFQVPKWMKQQLVCVGAVFGSCEWLAAKPRSWKVLAVGLRNKRNSCVLV